jgi:hypothetical protein
VQSSSNPSQANTTGTVGSCEPVGPGVTGRHYLTLIGLIEPENKKNNHKSDDTLSPCCGHQWNLPQCMYSQSKCYMIEEKTRRAASPIFPALGSGSFAISTFVGARKNERQRLCSELMNRLHPCLRSSPFGLFVRPVVCLHYFITSWHSTTAWTADLPARLPGVYTVRGIFVVLILVRSRLSYLFELLPNAFGLPCLALQSIRSVKIDGWC